MGEKRFEVKDLPAPGEINHNFWFVEKCNARCAILAIICPNCGKAIESTICQVFIFDTWMCHETSQIAILYSFIILTSINAAVASREEATRP